MNELVLKSISEWKTKFLIETLKFPIEECQSLLSILKSTNESLPNSRRIFNGMSIGFLRRLVSS